MCLILFAYQQHPTQRLILAANRDEYYQRASAPLAVWQDNPNILAGRDLVAGGTWLGVTRSARLAALTNYREPGMFQAEAPSRGALVSDFLDSKQTSLAYAQSLSPQADRYNGFNLLLFDGTELVYYSNRGGLPQRVAPGLHGLSNHLLNTPWPKVVRGRDKLRALLAAEAEVSLEALLKLLDDRWLPAAAELPATGLAAERERALAAMFIDADSYGTRSSTALMLSTNGTLSVAEQNYDDGKLRVFEL